MAGRARARWPQARSATGDPRAPGVFALCALLGGAVAQEKLEVSSPSSTLRLETRRVSIEIEGKSARPRTPTCLRRRLAQQLLGLTQQLHLRRRSA